MGNTAKAILDQALALSALERAVLAEQLLLSLDKPDPQIEALWAREAERRIDAYEKGEIDAVGVEEVFRKYDKS